MLRTQLSPGNSFGYTRYGYATEQIMRLKPDKHLDIGCYEGAWLHSLAQFGISGLHGIDVDADAIKMGQEKHPGLVLTHTTDTRSVPFADGEFDSITLLDVLEHLDHSYQRALLREINRVLRPGGLLVVTVPGRHIFSFLDVGNFKFIFPRLHRCYYTLRYGRKEYEYRYIHNLFGLVGDISVTKRWHEHFSADFLKDLLVNTGFRIIDVDGAGFFMRVLILINMLIPIKAIRRLNNVLQTEDSKRFSSANLFVTCARVVFNSDLSS